jgi:hypothetical protein
MSGAEKGAGESTLRIAPFKNCPIRETPATARRHTGGPSPMQVEVIQKFDAHRKQEML